MAAFDRPLEDPLVERRPRRRDPPDQRRRRHRGPGAPRRRARCARRCRHPDKLAANRDDARAPARRRAGRAAPGRGRQDRPVHRVRPRRAAPQRLHGDQPVPRAGRQAVPRRHGAARQRHPAGDRRVQELHHERPRLAGGGPATPPLPAPGAAHARAQRLLRRRRRGRVPLRHGPLPRRQQGRHRPPPRHMGSVAQPLPGAQGLVERPGRRRPGRPARGAGARAPAAPALPRPRLPAALRRLRDQEGQDDQEGCALPAVRGGQRHRRPHDGS